MNKYLFKTQVNLYHPYQIYHKIYHDVQGLH